MLLNADQVEQLLITNDLGARAQVGYDLTLKSANIVHGGLITKNKSAINTYTEMLPIRYGPVDEPKLLYEFSPGIAYSLTFDQGIKLDSKHTAMIKQRSSILRCGAIITSGLYDPGFSCDHIGAVMHTNAQIKIEKGARVAQLFMFENYEAQLYDGQYQGNKDVK